MNNNKRSFKSTDKDFDKSKGRKRRNNRNSRNDRQKDEMRDVPTSKELVQGSTNDVKWYANNPQLLRDAASYPFSQPVGKSWNTEFLGTTKKRSVPGVLALRTAPSYGWGGTISYDTSSEEFSYHGDVKSPINVAASELYSFIRHANSGAKNYESSDLMMYVAAISNMYSYITWAMRLYGLARMYDQYNRYMPQTLVILNGVNWGSLQNNLANYRYHLNVLINKVATLYVPSTMPIFQRLAFLYQNVYAEGPSTKDQLYMYVPKEFHKFLLDKKGAGCVGYEEGLAIPDPSSDKLLTWDQVIDIGENMFQAIWDEEDFATMSGDILKAFGGNVLSVNVMNEDYGLVPVFDEMVLTQIKNATVGGFAQTSNSSDTYALNMWNVATSLYQESTSKYTSVLVPCAFVQGRSYTSASAGKGFASAGPEDIFRRNQLITIPSVDPTPEMVIESSRMKCGFTGVVTTIGNETTGQKWFNITPTSEVVNDMWVAYNEAGENEFRYLPIKGTTLIPTNSPTTNLAYYYRYLQMVKAFKYMPELIVILATSTNTEVAEVSEDVLFEVDNYTVVGREEIEKLNESALLSLYAVNSLGHNA